MLNCRMRFSVKIVTKKFAGTKNFSIFVYHNRGVLPLLINLTNLTQDLPELPDCQEGHPFLSLRFGFAAGLLDILFTTHR